MHIRRKSYFSLGILQIALSSAYLLRLILNSKYSNVRHYNAHKGQLSLVSTKARDLFCTTKCKLRFSFLLSLLPYLYSLSSPFSLYKTLLSPSSFFYLLTAIKFLLLCCFVSRMSLIYARNL